MYFSSPFALPAAWRIIRRKTQWAVSRPRSLYTTRGCAGQMTSAPVASPASAGELPRHLDHARDEGGHDPLAGLASRLRRVADDARGGDVAQHVHRHDDAGAFVSHAVLAKRRPRQTRGPHRLAAVVGVSARLGL